MVESVTKKVRLSPEHAELLRALADKEGTTESEILRMGILLLGEREERARAVEGLIEMMRYGRPGDDRFELR